MTDHDAHDLIVENLKRLRPLTPDPARTTRVRAQCLAELARSQRRSERTALIGAFGRQVLAPVVVLGLCALYVASLVVNALRVRGVF